MVFRTHKSCVLNRLWHTDPMNYEKQHFEKDAQGRTLFFPFGNVGSGYLVETEEERQRIIKSIQLQRRISYLLIAAIFGFFILTPRETLQGFVNSDFAIVGFIFLILAGAVFSRISHKRLTKNLVKTSQSKSPPPLWRSLMIFVILALMLVLVICASISLLKSPRGYDLYDVLLVAFSVLVSAAGLLLNAKFMYRRIVKNSPQP